MINHLLQQASQLLQWLLTWPVLIQIGVVLLLPLLGAWVKRLYRRRLPALKEQVSRWRIAQHSPWLLAIFTLIDSVLQPLTASLLGRLAVLVLENYDGEVGLLRWAIPFFVMWGLYALFVQIATLRLSPKQAQTWKKQLIRPGFIILGLLHGFGLLDAILNYEINLNKGALTTLQSVIVGLAVFVVFMLASGHVRSLLQDVIFPQAGVDPSVNQIISTFSSYAVAVAGFWLGLTVAGIDITTLTFIVGGISIGIGFGLQELINNFISGFILLLERSLVPGDVIQVEDMLGVVEEIKLRTMKIRTVDDIELIVPNGHLFNNIVVNYNQARGRRKKRIHISVSASYADDPHLVISLIQKAAEQAQVAKKPKPKVLITDFGADGIQYDLLVWISDAMKIPFVQSDLRLRIWELFKDAGVEIPFPQRDVHLHSHRNTRPEQLHGLDEETS
jgi:small-conductance mechanosensitive channel